METTRYGNLPGVELAGLDTPALLIDLDVMERNLRTMAQFFAHRPAKLRPHAKTHKSPIVAHKQLALGAVGITCAKLGEAEVMVEAGVPDILIANQIVSPVKIARLMGLLPHARVTVVVDDPANLRDLARAASDRSLELGVLIEVNTGMNRCGVEPGEAALGLARVAADLPGIRFRGIQAYEGHLVNIEVEADRAGRVAAAMAPIVETRELLQREGLPVEIVSGGGTGTFALTGSTAGFDEVQAGSYVFMDAKYATIQGVGECFGTALTIASTVVSRPTSDRAVLDIGRKSIGIDHGVPQLKGIPGARFESYSEEHTKLQLSDAARDLRPGDIVEVIPGHACTTVNLYDQYLVMRGGVVDAVWPVAARGRAR